jgi:RNase H-fold protein (predicted Holliday junction resolvase)
MAENIFIKNRDDLMVLLVEDDNSSVRAKEKLDANLCLYFDSISCSLKIYGL